MGKKKTYHIKKAVSKDAAVSTADTALPSEHSLSTVTHLHEAEPKISDLPTEREQEAQQENSSSVHTDIMVKHESTYHNHDPVPGKQAEKSLHPYALAAAEQRKPAHRKKNSRSSDKKEAPEENAETKKEQAGSASDSSSSQRPEKNTEKKQSKLQNEPDSSKKESKLKFDDTDTNGQPGMIGTVKKGASKTIEKTAAAVSTYAHGKIHEAEHENSAVEGSHKAELLAEQGIRKLKHDSQNRKQNSQENGQGKKLKESPAENTSALHHDDIPSSIQPKEEKKGLLNRFYQKKQNKKRASEAMKAAKQGGQTAEKAFETAASTTEQTIILLAGTPKKRKRSLYAVIAVLLIVLILVTQLHSCSMMTAGTFSSVTSSSWPAYDEEI
ncbi:MAG: hypothetical protein II993_02480, partial [Anaerotignum sp.]|nr:hypothetical protein [Anaerotignum sp.]